MGTFYPSGVLQWTARLNNTDIVYAADPNTLAGEIQAIEQYVGTNPQTEPNPPLSSMTSTFDSMSARLSATARGDFMPYCSLVASYAAPGMSTPSGYKKILSYSVSADPYGMYNGTDITLPCSGVWLLAAEIDWDPAAQSVSGAQVMYFVINGTNDIFDAIEVTPTLLDQCSEYWNDQLWNSRQKVKILDAGARIQVLAWNATNINISIMSTSLTAVCLRQIPS